MRHSVGPDNRLRELDGVRALSILPVLGLHATYGNLFVGGFLGVDMFFVLSGYLITRLLLIEERATARVDLTAFYMRRVFRILPPLLLCLAIAVPLRDDAVQERLLVVASAIGFFANFLPAETLGNLGPIWSLAIEEQFYLVWPLVVALFFRRSPWLITAFALVVILAAMTCRVTLHELGWPPKAIYTFTFARMDSIMIGCVLALAEPMLPAISAKAMRALGYTAIVAIAACLLAADRDYMSVSAWAFPLFEVTVAVLIFVLPRLAAGSWLRTGFAHAIPVYIGQRSYGIYLYHYPIFRAFEAFRVPGSAVNLVAVLAAEAVLTLVVAELSWRYVEQPALRAKSRFMARRRGRAAAAAGGQVAAE